MEETEKMDPRYDRNINISMRYHDRIVYFEQFYDALMGSSKHCKMIKKLMNLVKTHGSFQHVEIFE